MSGISLYLKKNKVEREAITLYPTESLKDENGNRVPFVFRAITTDENNRISDECTRQVQIPGKKNQYRSEFNRAAYQNKFVAACCVEPELRNAELQDSYGVKTPEALITAIIDNPGEFAELFGELAKLCGFTSDEDKVEEVKN